MCMSAPKIPKPPAPPVVETVDKNAMAAQDIERKRRAAMAGRNSTILTGSMAPAAPSAGKTLLGG